MPSTVKPVVLLPAMNSPSANSNVSPGRNGKKRPHSTKTMASEIQMNAAPYSCCSHSGSSHSIPNSMGTTAGVATSVFTPPRYRPIPNGVAVRVPIVAEDFDDQRAPYDPMPHGPAEVGLGPWEGPWPEGEQYDAALLAEGDRRNVVDRYRYWTLEAIVADLDTRRHTFHVAIENWQHDFNIGTIVRSANAFLAQEVHIVGNRRWNRRGAMVTDRYQHVRHHPTVADLHDYLAAAAVLTGPGAAARHRQPPRIGAPGDDGDPAPGLLPVRSGGSRAVGCRPRGV